MMMRKEYAFTSFVTVLIFFMMQHYQGTLITLVVFAAGTMMLGGAMLRNYTMYFEFLINANPGVWELIKDKDPQIQNKKRIEDISRMLIMSMIIVFYSLTILTGGRNLQYSMYLNGFEYVMIGIAVWIISLLLNHFDIWQLKKSIEAYSTYDNY